MRKTKIICTLGPACDDEVLLKQMIQNGEFRVSDEALADALISHTWEA